MVVLAGLRHITMQAGDVRQPGCATTRPCATPAVQWLCDMGLRAQRACVCLFVCVVLCLCVYVAVASQLRGAFWAAHALHTCAHGSVCSGAVCAPSCERPPLPSTAQPVRGQLPPRVIMPGAPALVRGGVYGAPGLVRMHPACAWLGGGCQDMVRRGPLWVVCVFCCVLGDAGIGLVWAGGSRAPSVHACSVQLVPGGCWAVREEGCHGWQQALPPPRPSQQPVCTESCAHGGRLPPPQLWRAAPCAAAHPAGGARGWPVLCTAGGAGAAAGGVQAVEGRAAPAA